MYVYVFVNVGIRAGDTTHALQNDTWPNDNCNVSTTLEDLEICAFITVITIYGQRGLM